MYVEYLETEKLHGDGITREWWRVGDDEFAINSDGSVVDNEGFPVDDNTYAEVKSQVRPADGWYSVHPDGGATVLVRTKKGEVDLIVEEAEFETHLKANDSLACYIRDYDPDKIDDHLPEVAQAYARFSNQHQFEGHAQEL